ncbi:uncharacterized protein LACBIDRAFT_292032 [Laccaria bicolor S238N-H82]|uniref:Predicted protein n=1 Tax=Laccaria bicolor (strain S238N-H82 / ATCC MYA-4686) TaxID=486041 RepID=B0CTY5_LACBS|nr:uncharacterized protein LACBIDRAFT_292032 [Laccaria bicolor S238N-H82]EDR14579.1 predicted protein [Laccaria bicolor S238N-H82]|eukprot:XP_001875138.1 predicted protein [Laccaria bicolor S238N-H82]
MHPALLIDEVIRNVFDICSEQGLYTLSRAARCCKAWKDPALDFIWVRLPSAEPLLRLLPAVSYVNGEYILSGSISLSEMETFNSYASRVVHIVHRNGVKIHPNVASLMLKDGKHEIPFRICALPNLRTARVSSTTSPALVETLIYCEKLRELDLDFGFKTKSPLLDDHIYECLNDVIRRSVDLRKLHVRGLASSRFHALVSSMSRLEALSLRLGKSLMPETIKTVMSFPNLQGLEIHARHLVRDDLDNVFHTGTVDTFPALRKLDINAHIPIIEFILQNISPDTLQYIRLEAEDPEPGPSWDGCFTLIAHKASNTLEEITLEHHFEMLEQDIESNGDPATSASESQKENLPFSTLRLLRDLRHVRRFTLDLTLPPAISDKDVEDLVCWWPNIEHLELGSAPQVQPVHPPPTSQMTIRSLASFARHSKKLRTLSLPLDPHKSGPEDSADDLPNLCSTNNLRTLRIGHPSLPDPVEMASYFHRLFPQLTEVVGPCEQDEAWIHTREALERLRAPSIEC